MNKDETNNLQEQISEIKRRLDNKDVQQLTYTLDPISEAVLEQSNFKVKSVASQGTGTFGTQSVNVVGGGGGTVTVPAQPGGTIKVNIGGTVYELLRK